MGTNSLPQPNPHHHYLQRVQVGRVLVHQVRPPEVGTGHLQLALSSCPFGHDFAVLIQKRHVHLEVVTALDNNPLIHPPYRRDQMREKVGGRDLGSYR